MAIPKKVKQEMIDELAAFIKQWDETTIKDSELFDRVYGRYGQHRPFIGEDFYRRMAEAAFAVMEAAGEAQQYAVKEGYMMYDCNDCYEDC